MRLAIELAATLAKTGAVVNSAELRELRAVPEATGMPLDPLNQLEIRDSRQDVPPAERQLRRSFQLLD